VGELLTKSIYSRNESEASSGPKNHRFDAATSRSICLVVENSFQYLPLISVEFSSQKIGVCNNFNMIGG
jgi:hypothetical protein